LRPRPWPNLFEAKAKATTVCPRAVLEVENSPQGPHPWDWRWVGVVVGVGCDWFRVMADYL